MVWTCGTLQWCNQHNLWHRLMESVGLGGPKWHESSWQRGIAESGSSRLSTLMIDVPGDLVWDLPCVQQASYLEGGPLMWMLPLYLHVNQKSDYDDMMTIYGHGGHLGQRTVTNLAIFYPLSKEAPCEIWAKSAQRFQRRSCLKFWTFFPYKCIRKLTLP